MSQERWARDMTKDFSADAILDSLGLARKSQQSSWLWPAVGGVAVGLCAGVAIGMAFAPKRGSELRNEVSEKLKAGDLTGLKETARSSIAEARGTTTSSART
jgi:hypothetical protein